MSCDDIRDLLPLYAGGELEEGERILAEAHLDHCASCARELDLYREDGARFADLRGDEPPPGTWKVLHEGIRAELFPRKAPRPRLALRFAAALLLGLAVGFSVHQTRRGTPAPPAVRGAHEVVDAGSMRARPAAAVRIPVESSPGFHAPRATPEGRHHLPRVESFPPPGERDF
jgi:anti-sigma factor RsiW